MMKKNCHKKIHFSLFLLLFNCHKNINNFVCCIISFSSFVGIKKIEKPQKHTKIMIILKFFIYSLVDNVFSNL